MSGSRFWFLLSSGVLLGLNAFGCGSMTAGGGGTSVSVGDVKGDGGLSADSASAKADGGDATNNDQASSDDVLQPGALIANGDGTVTDQGTGLMWQETATIQYVKEPAAYTTCKNFNAGGYVDWRVPTIDELRTLIHGCAATVTGGSCEVTEACDCWSSVCTGCSELKGPGAAGCYLNPMLGGNCAFYWTSSPVTTNPGYTWGVTFRSGKVSGHDRDEANPVRCVR